MKMFRLNILVLALLLLSSLLAGCGSDNIYKPSNDNEQSGDAVNSGSSTDALPDDQTSTGSDETLTSHIVLEDGLQDAFHCVTGEAPVDVSILSPAIDVTRVEVQQLTSSGVCYYQFEVEFGELDKILDPNWGVISFLPLDFTDQNQPNYPYPIGVSRTIFKWHYKGPKAKNIQLIIEHVNDKGMNEGLTDDRFSVEVERNKYIVEIPCDLAPAGSGWYLSVEDEEGLYCDLVGYTPGSNQSLEFPVGEE